MYVVYLPYHRKDPSPTPEPTQEPTSTEPTPTEQTPTPPTPTQVTPTPTTPVPTEPATTGNVVIVDIFYDGVVSSNEPDEYVVIRNDDTKSIQLQSWTLRDIADHIYTFPSFVMLPGHVRRVYTNESYTDWCGFNYGSGSAIWNNSGDCAYLRDGQGIQVDEYCYP
jgi:micrococcal nuclease